MLKRVFFIFCLVLISAVGLAQDRMAAISPTDVPMKKIDSLMLKQLRARENALGNGELGTNQSSRNNLVPDSFVINLKNFKMPTTSRVVTSNYGRRWGRMHKGIDLKVYIGDTIRTAFDGKVTKVKYEPEGYGNYVVIKHKNGLETVYAHLSKQLVIVNQTVKAGTPIGLGGNTGRSTGSHLHFETRLFGIAINPALLFDFVHQDVIADTYVFRKKEHTLTQGKQIAHK